MKHVGDALSREGRCLKVGESSAEKKCIDVIYLHAENFHFQKYCSPQLGPKAGLDVVDLSLLGRGVVRFVAAHDHHRVVKVAAVLGQLAEDLSGPIALLSKLEDTQDRKSLLC